MANTMDWADVPTVERAQAIFDDAFAHVSDPKTRDRLRYAYLPVQYAALVAPPDVRYAGDALVLKRPQSQTFDEYWDMLNDYGVTHLNDYSIDVFRERLGGATPPRRRHVPLVKLQNGRYEVWIAPEQHGAVVRMQDRRSGRELLTAYPSFAASDDHYLEWQEKNGRLQRLDAAFDVIAMDGRRVVLEGTLDDGLVLQRSTALDENIISFAWTVRNPTPNPVTPNLRIRPTFRGAGDVDWDVDSAKLTVHLRDPRETLQLAYEGVSAMPVVQQTSEERGYSPAVPLVDGPLAPGAAHTLSAKVRVTDKRPRRL